METDSSQKTKSSQTHVYAFIEGRIARYDGPRLLTQARLHSTVHVTAPHSFNMLLQQRAKERRLSVISRKHSTTSAHFARKNWHNAAAQDHVTIQNGHRITTAAHCVHKIRTAPQRGTAQRSKMATAPQRQLTLFTKFTTPQRENTLRSKMATAPQRQRTLCTKFAPAPQRETTLRFKMATAPQRQPTLFTKFALRHNGRSRYDPKLSPRQTRARNHNVLLAQSTKHVTIASFPSRAPLFDHKVLQVLRLPREMILGC